MTRRAPPLALTLVVLLTALVPAAAAAADPPLPDSMAAVGDSITRAASTGGTLGADYPANSWATGTNTTVNSHARRLGALGAQLTTHNLAVSGAKMANLDAQMINVVNVQPDYVTILMGGNDLCTDTVGAMTSVTNFRSQFQTAMTRLMNGTTDTVVYVVSIPNVYQLWNLFKGNFWARFIWSSAAICQSLLANPTSTQAADVNRREAVRQRNIAYNTELKNICAAYVSRCRFDNNAAFNTTFTSSDVSGDYFHPSIAGQAKLASVSWASGYTWATSPPPNTAPTASFTSSCVDLVCSFNGSGSTDADGSITGWSWAFGDTTTGSGVTTSRTYGGAGTYQVTLTVTDNEGATGSLTQSVQATSTPSNTAPVASFSFACVDLGCDFTDASIDSDGTIASRAWSFGDGGTSTATSPPHTFAAAGIYQVSLTVTDNLGASDTEVQSVAVSGPVSAAKIRVSSLTGIGVDVNRNFWRADVVVTVTDTNGAAIGGATVSGTFAGVAKSCTTTTAGTCQLSSDNLRHTVTSATFLLSGVSHATLVYDSSANLTTSVTVPRPT